MLLGEEGGRFCDVQKLVRIHRMKEQAGSDSSVCLGNGVILQSSVTGRSRVLR